MSNIKNTILRNTRKNRYTKNIWAEFDEHQLNQLNVEVDIMVKRIAELEKENTELRDLASEYLSRILKGGDE
jgi:predicted  nucleic acid-binding Zn-ribbon protein